MRIRSVITISLLLLLAAAGVSAAQTAGSADALETVGQGTINWTSGEVFATGIGAPPTNAANPAQARAMAERAAMVVALRNLLETVKGVRVDSETVVENFVTTSDIIRTRVSGIVRGAMPVRKQYLSDGSVEITVALKMRGPLLDAIIPGSFGSAGGAVTTVLPVPVMPAPPAPPDTRPLPPAKKPQPAPPALPPQGKPEQHAEPLRPEPPRPTPPQQPQSPEPPKQTPLPKPPAAAPDQQTTQFKGGKATGIVIDGRGLGLKPALLPKIVDPQGQEIYVGQVVTRTNAVEQGVAGYAKDVNAAANNFRVTDNPAIIKGVRASGAGRTDVMLGQADAQALRDLSTKGDFLQFCRVIIVY